MRRFMKRNLLLISIKPLLVSALSLTPSASQSAVTLVDTLNNRSHGNWAVYQTTAWGYYSYGYLAQSFMTPNEPTVLEDITISLNQMDTNALGGLRVSLCLDEAGVPGSQLEVLMRDDPPLKGNNDYSGNAFLLPNTAYWVVLDTTTVNGSFYYPTTSWNSTNSGLAALGPMTTKQWHRDWNDSGVWLKRDGESLNMKVTANPVPEPSPAWLAVIGAMALMWSRASKR